MSAWRHRPPHRPPRALRIAAALGVTMLAVAPTPAAAWDPSSTHAGIVSQAMTESAVHLRWMEGSELSRGLFSSLRIDPARLNEDLRRRIVLAQRRAHADSGAAGLGGPGACPGVSAPPSTRTLCVSGDAWEATALGWVAFGLVAEVSPRERLLHHFVDPADPTAVRWTSAKIPRRALRATQRRGDGANLATVTGTAYAGEAASAVAWLSDPEDPWAPPAMFEHLRKASMLADPDARQHHLALAMVGLGALLHVLQDTGVPAHARADLAAFLAPLSAIPGDRGLPVAEFAKLAYGRTLPQPLVLSPRSTNPDPGSSPASPSGRLATTLLGHIVGDPQTGYEGLAVMAGTRFLSEGTLPSPVVIAPTLDATAAAARLLQDTGLDAVELDGARLAPWPAAEGYVLSSAARPLAAFSTDALHRTTVQLDRRVYRDQAGQLIPAAVAASRSLVELIFPAWPKTAYEPGADVLTLDASALPGTQPTLTILVEDGKGHRRKHRSVLLRPGIRQRVVGAIPRLTKGERVVLVVQSTIGDNRLTIESLLPSNDPASAPGQDVLPPTVRGDPSAEDAEDTEDGGEITDGTVQTPPDEKPSTAPTTETPATGAPPGEPSDRVATPPAVPVDPPTTPDGARAPSTVAQPDAP